MNAREAKQFERAKRTAIINSERFHAGYVVIRTPSGFAALPMRVVAEETPYMFVALQPVVAGPDPLVDVDDDTHVQHSTWCPAFDATGACSCIAEAL